MEKTNEIEIIQKPDLQEVERFLSISNIKLEPDEKVIHYQEVPIKEKYEKSEKLTRIENLVFIVSSIITISLGYFITPSLGIITGGICYLSGLSTTNFLLREYQPFGILTSTGIRTTKTRKIEWRKVVNVERREYGSFEYIVFHLIADEDVISFRGLGLGHAQQTTDLVYWGKNKKADQLYETILEYWEPNDPLQAILKRIAENLNEKYNLEVSNYTPITVELQGQFQDLDLFCSYSKRLPFKDVKSTITTTRKIGFYLRIRPREIRQFLDDDIELILTGDRKIDHDYLIYGSHPEFIKTLFTEKVINRFKHISQWGMLSWSFGEPLKKKRLRKIVSSIRDEEQVLDSQLLKSEEPTEEFEYVTSESYSTLKFKGKPDYDFTSNTKVAYDFVNLGMILSMHFMDKIREFKA